MSDKSTAPVISPDGRFEVIIEENCDDRGFVSYDAYLVERATGERLFAFNGSHNAEFAGDGLLSIHYPFYEPGGAQIDPMKRAFRTRPSDPWVPTAAWGIVQSALQRGWAQGVKYQKQKRMSPVLFPWVEILLLLGSIVALSALSVQTFLPDAKSSALVVVAAMGVLFFGLLTANGVRLWMRERMREKTPRGKQALSPDGRFEVIIEDPYDRGIPDYYTVLVERATGERIFACEGSLRAEFARDGMLTVHYPGYEPDGVQIDPVKRAFRTHPSDRWVPASAWGIVETAFKHDRAQGIAYQQRHQPPPVRFPWETISVLLGSIVALALLTFLPNAKSAAPVVVAAIGVLLFGWLTAVEVREWTQERMWERMQAHSPGGVGRSSRPG